MHCGFFLHRSGWSIAIIVALRFHNQTHTHTSNTTLSSTNIFLRHEIEKRLRAVKTQEANGSHGKLVSWLHSLSRVNAKYTVENQVRGRILKDQTENVYFHFFQCTPKNGQKRPFHFHSHCSVNPNLRGRKSGERQKRLVVGWLQTTEERPTKEKCKAKAKEK